MPLIIWIHYPVALIGSQSLCGDILEWDVFFFTGFATFFDIPGFKEPLTFFLEFCIQAG
ncbi:hypothetical protein D3C78_1747150 [compost metagenome]